MADSSRFALLRPELLSECERGEEKIKQLMRGKSLELRARTVLVQAQTEHPYVYRLVSGWACRCRTLEDGRTQLILIFLPGDLFAVKSMFLKRHPDSVQALSDAVVERLDYRDLHAAYIRDGDVASRCIYQVMEEERRLHNWVVGLGQGSAEERLAMLVVDLRARLANSQAIDDDATAFALPLNQSQLGDYLGLTAVHVNRVLKVLREEGVLTLRDGIVTIDSMELLLRRAHPLLDVFERTDPALLNTSSLRA